MVGLFDQKHKLRSLGLYGKFIFEISLFFCSFLLTFMVFQLQKNRVLCKPFFLCFIFKVEIFFQKLCLQKYLYVKKSIQKLKKLYCVVVFYLLLNIFFKTSSYFRIRFNVSFCPCICLNLKNFKCVFLEYFFMNISEKFFCM